MAREPNLQIATLEQMSRAIELVEERLQRSTTALDSASVPYAVIGAKAVAYWVGTKDKGAIRNTPNLDILAQRGDFARVKPALEATGFVYTNSPPTRADFLDGPDGKLRQAVRVWFCGDVLKPATEPYRTSFTASAPNCSKWSRWSRWFA